MKSDERWKVKICTHHSFFLIGSGPNDQLFFTSLEVMYELQFLSIPGIESLPASAIRII